MNLTKTQQYLIDTMLTNAPKYVEACHAFRDSRYKDRAATERSQYLFTSIKDAFKAIIYEWLEAKGIEACIRSEMRVRLRYPDFELREISLGATSIFNGKGSLPGSRSRWINKVTVTVSRGKVKVRSHKARTDPDFLEPTATEFTALIQAITDALGLALTYNSKRPGRSGRGVVFSTAEPELLHDLARHNRNANLLHMA